MGWRVVTFDDTAFVDACARLKKMLEDYAPDLIIGVPTAGVRVVECMFPDADFVSIECPYRNIKVKSAGAKKILHSMPRPMLNFIRRTMAAFLNTRHVDFTKIHPFEIEPDISDRLKKANRILIVDDAVDTGRTMTMVSRSVRAVVGVETIIRHAAITVTSDRPLIMPEYALYADRILIRFPWSADA